MKGEGERGKGRKERGERKRREKGGGRETDEEGDRAGRRKKGGGQMLLGLSHAMSCPPYNEVPVTSLLTVCLSWWCCMAMLRPPRPTRWYTRGQNGGRIKLSCFM